MDIDKLFNCDCMEFMKSMPDMSVDMTLTDIPYEEVNENKGCNNLRNIDKGVADNKTFELQDFLEQVERITKGTFVIWCGIEQVPIIYRFFKDKGYPTRQLVWKKTNPSPMNGDKMYLSATENAVWAKRGGQPSMQNAYQMCLNIRQVQARYTQQKRTTIYYDS